MTSKARRLSSNQASIILKNERGIEELVNLINQVELEYPIEVSIGEFKDSRSKAQNRLQHQWWKDAESQGDQKAWEYRAYCKLHFGIPILRRDSREYRDAYDQVLRPLSYEHKLILMREPMDYPVTRAMTVKQHTEFLDMVKEHLNGLGFRLTDPEEMMICQSHE